MDPHRTGSLDPKQRENLRNKAVLWIRNDLVRILHFKPCQLNIWQILCVHNGTAARLFNNFKI
jgi:hypothetical protein